MFTRFNQDYFRDSLTFPRTAFASFGINTTSFRQDLLDDFLEIGPISPIKRFVSYAILDDWTIRITLKDRTGFSMGEEKFFTNISIQGKDVDGFEIDERTTKIVTKHSTYIFDICNILNIQASLTRQDQSGPNDVHIPDLASVHFEFSQKEIAVMVTAKKYVYLEDIFGQFERTVTEDLKDFFAPETEHEIFKDHYVVNTPLELNALMYKKLKKSRYKVRPTRIDESISYPAVISLSGIKSGETFNLQHSSVEKLEAMLADMKQRYD